VNEGSIGSNMKETLTHGMAASRIATFTHAMSASHGNQLEQSLLSFTLTHAKTLHALAILSLPAGREAMPFVQAGEPGTS
jgi:hypothetical protein